MKQYLITEDRLLGLLEDSIRLGALDADGVDNWSWYGEGFSHYIASYFPNKSLEDICEENIGFKECAMLELETKFTEVKDLPITSFSGEYEFLSNFYPSTIVADDGLTYPTVEHYFQAQKTLNPREKEEIRTAATPGQAKRLGRKATMQHSWEMIRVPTMYSGLQRKFRNPKLLQKLLSTGNSLLVEGNQWHDNTWGNCTCAKCENIEGENLLGKMLMSIRKELSRKTPR